MIEEDKGQKPADNNYKQETVKKNATNPTNLTNTTNIVTLPTTTTPPLVKNVHSSSQLFITNIANIYNHNISNIMKEAEKLIKT
jgi:hypothetical protein